MGLRFRKSIRLGGGFNINLSKSGIGYSWGTKGYRISKKSSGGTRQTVSVPGTGISYVKDSKHSKQKHKLSSDTEQNIATNNCDANVVDVKTYENGDIKNMVSSGLESLTKSASFALVLNLITTIVIVVGLFVGFTFNVWLLIIAAVGIVLKALVQTCCQVKLNYEVDEELSAEIDKHMAPLKQIAKSQRVWYIATTTRVENTKYTSGAKELVSRKGGRVSTITPFPFKTNKEAITFKCGAEKYVFLPDKLFVIRNLSVGAVDYGDVQTYFTTTNFVETNTVPTDAKIIDYTWEYTNASGGADKRFANNKKLPVCKYGEMHIKSDSKGIDTVIMFSNCNIDV